MVVRQCRLRRLDRIRKGEGQHLCGSDEEGEEEGRRRSSEEKRKLGGGVGMRRR